MTRARWTAPGRTPRLHGGATADEMAAAGIDAGDLIDFSVNVNPYGPCPTVLEAVRSAPVHLYPDPSASRVRRAIAARTEISADRIVFGSGAAELLWTLARTVLSEERRILIVEPAFSELRAAARSVGAPILSWRARPARQLAVDLASVERAARRGQPEIIALCAPTTPVGRAVPLQEVAELARRLPHRLLLLDESFLPLSDRSEDADLSLPGNVVRLRSLTKSHAIPGVRAGYLVAPPALARALEANRPAWSTSSAAQSAALASLSRAAEAFVAHSRERLRLDRLATADGLAQLGLTPFPSIAPYLAFPVEGAAELRRRLLARGIAVRDCASFGLSDVLRVAARPAPERRRLLAALGAELENRK